MFKGVTYTDAYENIQTAYFPQICPVFAENNATLLPILQSEISFLLNIIIILIIEYWINFNILSPQKSGSLVCKCVAGWHLFVIANGEKCDTFDTTHRCTGFRDD